MDVKTLRWVPPRPDAKAPVILVVEDDPDARQVAVSMLHMVGYRTLTARDGNEALSVLKTQRPAAILLDLHMPGLDGIGFLDIARRELDYDEELPIIATSGVYRDEAAIERPLRRRRVVTFVHKPFTLGQLKAGLAQAKVLELFPPLPSGDGGPAPRGSDRRRCRPRARGRRGGRRRDRRAV
ncbi:MAG: response regulator [Proteobacteria bacterium]|nr:response regulator [Pseudomonadota bacterium]